MSAQEIKVPDIGDFSEIPVIEIHVAAGDTVAAEDPLVTLESDKATLDVPAPVAGTVTDLRVAVGDTVSEGSVIMVIDAESGDAAPAASATTPIQQVTETAAAQPAAAAPAAPAAAANIGRGDQHAEVLVLGAGPGGYTAAFRAADLGKQVVMIDSRGPLGGVCLNVGCIPSKALLHAAKVIAETKEMSGNGLAFAAPTVDLDALRGWKQSVVNRLTGGLSGLAKQRKVTTLVGTGKFTSPHMVEVTAADGSISTVSFEQAIIAAGSEPVTLPFVPHDDPRVINSAGALELDGIPQRLLILGGGIIGLEMATVYHELGSTVSVVELLDQLIPGADADLVKPLTRWLSKRYQDIWVKTKVTNVQGRTGWSDRLLRGRQGPRVGGVRQGPGRGRSQAQREGDRRRGRGRAGRRTRVHPGGQAAAYQRGAHLRHRRRRRPADARAQGHPRGQGRRRGHRRAQQLLRRHRHPRRWPTPTPRWPGSASPKTRRRPPASNTARRPSRGRPAAVRCRWAATRA